MRIDGLLKNWETRLAAAGIETPALEAELLYVVEGFLHVARKRLLQHGR